MSLPAGTHIAVDGPIGAGTTSLARILSDEFDTRLELEDPTANPFLPDFYRDPRRFALQTQLSFLLFRHRQQASLRQLSLFHRTVVTDYIFEKDFIFAHMNLDERELDLYNRVAGILVKDVPNPDMVVYLQSSPGRLLTNIRVRDIEYERLLELDYLRQLCEAYSRFFFQWDRSPLLIVNASRIDFVNNVDHRRQLLKMVAAMPVGTTFFNPEA